MKKIVAVAFVLISCGRPPAGAERSAESLDNFFASQFPNDEPGGAVLIIKGETVLFSKGYGYADMRTQEPITSKTLFNIGSVSKTFVANAILILREQGKLSLDDDLLLYFPEFKNDAIAKKVKIKHLLTHSSGLPDNRQVYKDTVFYLTAKDAENWAPLLNTDSLLFEPGTRFEYSNPAFNGLALIVEKVSGVRWQSFIEDNIMRVAEMQYSTITDGNHPERGVSHGYVRDGGRWIEDDYGEEPTFPAAGNGGVWSSVEELAKYELAIRNNAFLNPASNAEARTVSFSNYKGMYRKSLDWSWFQPQTPDRPFIGWSWFISERSDMRTVGHTGTQGGFLCNYVSIPDQEIFFVVLTNSPRDWHGMSDKIMDWLKAQGHLL